MTALERHGEIMGALGKIEQKADDCHDQLLRHESMHETHTENIDSLKDSVAKGKGIAITATVGAAALAAIATVVARAKELF